MKLEGPRETTDIVASLRRSGYAWLDAATTYAHTGIDGAGWARLLGHWADLPRDVHLRDGGRYRARRHASLQHDVASGRLRLAPHRAHWQPVEYNALHGGMRRWFEPIVPAFLEDTGVQRAVRFVGEIAARLQPASCWYVEIHQVRIDTADGIGRPTPEGAHRDGVDFVAVWLAGRQGVRGGETRVFEADGARGVRFTMDEPGSVVLLDDARVIHETTPVLPRGRGGARDTLVVTYRSEGFLEPQ